LTRPVVQKSCTSTAPDRLEHSEHLLCHVFANRRALNRAEERERKYEIHRAVLERQLPSVCHFEMKVPSQLPSVVDLVLEQVDSEQVFRPSPILKKSQQWLSCATADVENACVGEGKKLRGDAADPA
jgi:hypothetical protein